MNAETIFAQRDIIVVKDHDLTRECPGSIPANGGVGKFGTATEFQQPAR